MCTPNARTHAHTNSNRYILFSQSYFLVDISIEYAVVLGMDGAKFMDFSFSRPDPSLSLLTQFSQWFGRRFGSVKFVSLLPLSLSLSLTRLPFSGNTQIPSNFYSPFIRERIICNILLIFVFCATLSFDRHLALAHSKRFLAKNIAYMLQCKLLKFGTMNQKKIQYGPLHSVKHFERDAYTNVCWMCVKMLHCSATTTTAAAAKATYRSSGVWACVCVCVFCRVSLLQVLVVFCIHTCVCRWHLCVKWYFRIRCMFLSFFFLLLVLHSVFLILYILLLPKTLGRKLMSSTSLPFGWFVVDANQLVQFGSGKYAHLFKENMYALHSNLIKLNNNDARHHLPAPILLLLHTTAAAATAPAPAQSFTESHFFLLLVGW